MEGVPRGQWRLQGTGHSLCCMLAWDTVPRAPVLRPTQLLPGGPGLEMGPQVLGRNGGFLEEAAPDWSRKGPCRLCWVCAAGNSTGRLGGPVTVWQRCHRLFATEQQFRSRLRQPAAR